MTEQIRLDFLNFQPDKEDFQNQGLTVATNTIHEPEGWKPVHIGSAGAFATTGGLAASVATVISIVTKPVGAQGDTFSAWLANDTVHVGINGVTSTSVTTGYPLSFSTSGPAEIVSFDLCEFAGFIFFTIEAQQQQFAPAAFQTLTAVGYMSY